MSLLLQRKHLDKILKRTKFSSATKALWTYYRRRQGRESKPLKEFELAVAKSKVPKHFQEVMALFLFNAQANGRTTFSSWDTREKLGLDFMYMGDWKACLLENPDKIDLIYAEMRKNTFSRWCEAVALIAAALPSRDR